MGAEMSPRERVVAALRRQPVDRIPYVEHYFHPQIAAAIAGGAQKLTTNRAALDALRDGRFDALDISAFDVIEPDISRVAGRDNVVYWGAFGPFEGNKSYVLDTETPALGYNSDGLLKTRADVARMRFRPMDEEFWRPAREFLRCRGPYAANAMLWLGVDPTWHSMGFEHFAVSCVEDPGLVGEFLERITEWTAAAARGLSALGFDFIWAADDIGYKSGPMFSPAVYRDVLLPHVRKVARAITVPWAYHSDGNLMPLLDDMLELGMNALHPLEPGSMDLRELKRRYGDRIAFIGNINLDLLSTGTPAEVREEVRARIGLLGPGYGYLLSSSNSITDYCRPENVVEMVRALKEYGRYPL
jgi:uroporphyrinogen-III decarboxylase